MRILACHIENFGKISDLSMTFDAGVNIINEPNGWGKSTLAAFLKVMFYGFESKKEKDAPEKERKLYQPWQGGTYGGTLDLEINGTRYRITRTFGKTEKSDQFQLINLATNLESQDYSANIGQEMFDLDSGSFKRSVFIAQNDCLSSATDAINAKLGNLVENTNDINNYETAQNRIRDLINKLTPDRVTGSLKRRKGLIVEIQEELKRLGAAEEAYGELKEKLAGKREEKASLEESRSSLSASLRVVSEAGKRTEQKKNYEQIAAETKQKEQTYQNLREAFPSEIPDPKELERCLEQARGLEEYQTTMRNFVFSSEEKAQYPRLTDMFQKGLPEEGQLARGKQWIQDLEDWKLSLAMGQLSSEEEQERERLSVLYEGHGPEEFQQKIDENARRMALEEEIGKLKTNYSWMEIAANQTRIQQSTKGTAPKQSPAFYTGIGLLVAGFILFLVGSTVLGASDSSLIFQALGAVLAVCGIGAVCSSVVGNKKRQNQKEEEARRQEEQQRKVLEPLEKLKTQIAEKQQEAGALEQELKQFLDAFQVECEPGRYQMMLYDLKNQQKIYGQLVAKASAGNDPKKLEQIRALTGDLDAFFHTYYEDISETSYRECLNDLRMDAANYRQMVSKSAAYETAKESYRQAKGDILEFLEDLQIPPEENLHHQLTGLQTAALECRIAGKAYQDALARKLEFEKQYDVTAFGEQPVNDYTIEELNQKIARLDQELEEVRDAIQQYEGQLGDLQEQMDRKDEREAELEECLELQEQESVKYEVLKSTQEYLQAAREQFTARYMAPISNGFRKYYQMLTGCAEETWMVDANMELKMKEQGAYRDAGWMSAGYQDLIGICMRLALVDAMYPEQKPFLVLDDPFVNLDKEKVGHGNQMLEKLGKEYQTIYFTCHDSRIP